ncbi:hypothetical protein ACEN2I_01680 [Flavobacterium sp. W22_SRS_FK3]|uniref:hypothetical protein n=1 Tax=Flavobacterium sp. W22_SRS_FK3 TaxID=3240275 RepID=UPI003F937344
MIINQKRKNKNSVLAKDCIFSSVQQIEFQDLNNHKIKDILVQNIFDVRIIGRTIYIYTMPKKTVSMK